MFRVSFVQSFPPPQKKAKNNKKTGEGRKEDSKERKKERHHKKTSSRIIMLGARHSDVFFGERESGKDVRQNNATAVQAVANIVKSSLGPVGLDKVRRRRRSSSCDFDF